MRYVINTDTMTVGWQITDLNSNETKLDELHIEYMVAEYVDGLPRDPSHQKTTFDEQLAIAWLETLQKTWPNTEFRVFRRLVFKTTWEEPK